MFYELVLLSAWVIGCVLITAAGFHAGKLIAKKVEAFFDRRRRL